MIEPRRPRFEIFYNQPDISGSFLRYRSESQAMLIKSPELASPPEAFRDPKVAFRDLKEEFRDQKNPLDIDPQDSCLPKDETKLSKSQQPSDVVAHQQKGSPLIARPLIKDHLSDSRLRQQKFTEARSSSVLSAPTLKERVAEEEEQKECSRIIESYSNSLSDRKMSRSNTISFGEGETTSAEQKVAEKLAELRLRRSTVEGAGEEGSTDPDLMEHKSLPQRPASVSSLAHGFYCSDWIPHKSLLNDERLLAKVTLSSNCCIFHIS